MDLFQFWDNLQRKVMTSKELMALECPFNSKDGFDFDDSDPDPTINNKDLEASDIEIEPETAVKTVESKDSSVAAVPISDKRRICSQKIFCGKNVALVFLVKYSHSKEIQSFIIQF